MAAETGPPVGEGEGCQIGRDQAGSTVMAGSEQDSVVGGGGQGVQQVGRGEGRKVGMEDHPCKGLSVGRRHRGCSCMVEPSRRGLSNARGAQPLRPCGNSLISGYDRHRTPGREGGGDHMGGHRSTEPSSLLGVEDGSEALLCNAEWFDRDGDQHRTGRHGCEWYRHNPALCRVVVAELERLGIGQSSRNGATIAERRHSDG